MEPTDNKYPAYPSPEEDIFASQYQVQQTIGYGTFGQVKKAYHHVTDSEVAVKILGTKEYPMLVENEVDIVKALNHPHVIRVYQVIQGEEHVYLVMEIATKGNLQSWIEASGWLYENEARRLLKQIGSALQYFHWHGIAHLDLKPDNILLDEHGNAKVSDFGLSLRIAPGQLITDLRGAYVFRAPEVYLKQAYDGFKVDVWCLGTILLFMITGKFPFKGSNSNQLCTEIVQGRYDVPPHLTVRGRHVLFRLLTLDPQQRPDIQQVMAHAWFDGVEEGFQYPVEPLPEQLDPTVMSEMCSLGYSESQIRTSVLHRSFDEVMATYLFIQDSLKAEVVTAGTAQSLEWGIQPYSMAPNLSTFLMERGDRFPSQIASLPLPSQWLLTCEKKQTGRRASLPAIPLCFLQRGSSHSLMASHESVVALQGSPLPQSHEETLLPRGKAKSLPCAQPQKENRGLRASKSQGCKGPGVRPKSYAWYGCKQPPEEAAQKVSAAELPACSAKTPSCSCFGPGCNTSEDIVFPLEQTQHDGRASRSRRKRGRKGVVTRMLSALRRLCCCVPAQ